MKKVFKIFHSIIESAIRNIGGTLGRRIRYIYYKNTLGACGKGVIIDIGVVFSNPQDIFVGDRVWIDNYVILLAGKLKGNRKVKRKDNPTYKYKDGQLHIGNNVHIAPHCVIQSHGGISIDHSSGIASGSKVYSLSHHYRNLNDLDDKETHYFTPMVAQKKQFLISAAVTIGQDCAIGLNSVVLPGTIIPDGTWIGVNSTMSGQNIEKNAVYISNKGQFLKYK